MNEYTRKLLDKSIDTIEGADLLLENGKIDMAAGAHTMLYSILQKLC